MALIFRNDLLRENVLFGKEFDEELYQRALEGTALINDIKLLKAGDQTEIGEKVIFSISISTICNR